MISRDMTAKPPTTPPAMAPAGIDLETSADVGVEGPLTLDPSRAELDIEFSVGIVMEVAVAIEGGVVVGSAADVVIDRASVAG